MSDRLRPKPKIFLISGLSILFGLALAITFSTMHHSTKTPKTAQPPSVSKTADSKPASFIDDNPITRFQDGRPSQVIGLTADTGQAGHQKVTFSWTANPTNEQVDEYALYYLDPNYSNAPNYLQGEVGILAAVIKGNSITTTLIANDSNYNFPYGQNIIPICTFNDGCAEEPVVINVWVIAHNKFGWGDNSPKTPNPDENPVTFVPLSINQGIQQKAPSPTVITLGTVDDPLYVTDWPAYEPEKNTNVNGLTDEGLINPTWIVPWVPQKVGPDSRFGPGRPTRVKNFHSKTTDLRKKFISFSWSPNPAAEKVDKYAIYMESSFCPDDKCGVFILNVQSSTSFSRALLFNGEPESNLVWANLFQPISNKYQSPGKTLNVSTASSYNFWVIAHNRYGWSDNDYDTPNPDQLSGDFRRLNKLEVSIIQSSQNAPFTGVGFDVPCSVQDHKNGKFGCL